MVLYRLIGQDTTNSSGVASVNYTGTGKGLTQIVASTDDPSHISEGSLQSEIYETLDCIYYETVPNGSLSHGTLTSGGSVSNDWSSIGDYSIKADLSSVNWVAYRISNPVIDKKGEATIDFNTANVRTTIGVYCNIGGTDRYIQQSVTSEENTVSFPFDFSEYDGTISRLDVRVIKYSSYTNPVYIDNIRVYLI